MLCAAARGESGWNDCEVHLEPWERDGIVEVWDEALIETNPDWRKKIKATFNSARVAVLIISEDFLASDCAAAEELMSLMLAAEQDGLVVLPVIVSPSRLTQTTAFCSFQTVHPPSKPLTAMTPEHQDDVALNIKNAIADAMRFNRPVSLAGSREHIAVIGGVNEEYVLQLDSLGVGKKNNVETYSMFGGSGLNYTMRLLNTEFPTIPILSAGNDYLGHRIMEQVLKTMDQVQMFEGALSFIRSDKFFVPGARSQRTTILVEEDRRTILTDHADEAGRYFDHMKSRVCLLNSHIRISTVIIGHIHADKQDGKCTRYIISYFNERNVPVFANPGDSQIRLGYRFWERDFQKLSVLQLNLNELKALFREDSNTKSLAGIIDWLTERRITAIITLDKLGAICTYGDGSDGMILALPLKLAHIVDTTGAGDAFGAAIASELYRKKVQAPDRAFSFQDLFFATKKARFWAAYACRTIGGAAGSPGLWELESLEREINGSGAQQVEVRSKTESQSILHLLDVAYSYADN